MHVYSISYPHMQAAVFNQTQPTESNTFNKCIVSSVFCPGQVAQWLEHHPTHPKGGRFDP